jgi:hypothetical protein
LHGALALKLHANKLLHFDDYEKTFVTKQGLKIHLKYHTGKRPYPCRIDNCKKVFPDRPSFARMRRVGEAHIVTSPRRPSFARIQTVDKAMKKKLIRAKLRCHSDFATMMSELCSGHFKKDDNDDDNTDNRNDDLGFA